MKKATAKGGLVAMENVRVVWSYFWRIVCAALTIVAINYYKNPKTFEGMSSGDLLTMVYMLAVLFITAVAMNYLWCLHLVRGVEKSGDTSGAKKPRE